jgi:Divergent InlB B-repeat domain
LYNFPQPDNRRGLDIYHYPLTEDQWEVYFFITNYNSGNVTVITVPYANGAQMYNPAYTNETSFYVGRDPNDIVHPYDIVYNPKTNKAYVTLWAEQGRVAVINFSNPKIPYITVGKNPGAIYLDKHANKTYVANSGSDSVSIIDTSNDKLFPSEISTPITRWGISFNPATKLLYISQADSNTVSVINTTTGGHVVAVNFNIKPQAAAHIECMKLPYNQIKTISSNYTLFDLETKLSCDAKPNTGFRFSSWSGSGVTSNQTNPLDFTVSKYGTTFTANFANELTLTEYQQRIVAYCAILGPILAISSFYGIIAIIRRKRQLKKHLKHIYNLKSQSYSNEEKYLHIADWDFTE